MPRQWSRFPNPCTSEVPMMMVSVPRCVAACWLFFVGSTGFCVGGSAWVDDLAAWAAAPISTTGIGCGDGRDEGCWDGLGCRCWDDACAVGIRWLATCRSWKAPVSADEELCWASPGLLWLCERLPRCLLWVTTLNSAGTSSSTAASRESVMLITFDRSESYFSAGTISLSLFADDDCWVSEDVLTFFFAYLRMPLKRDISRLSLSFSFISFLVSHFCVLSVLLIWSISEMSSSIWCKAVRPPLTPCSSILAANTWASNRNMASLLDSQLDVWVLSPDSVTSEHNISVKLLSPNRILEFVSPLSSNPCADLSPGEGIGVGAVDLGVPESGVRTVELGIPGSTCQLLFLHFLWSFALFLSLLCSCLWHFLDFLPTRLGSSLDSPSWLAFGLDCPEAEWTVIGQLTYWWART